MKQTIKQIRTAQGISQKALAKRLNMSLYAYRKLESNPLEGEIKQLLAHANELDVLVTDIFLSNNIANSNVKDERGVVDK